MDIKQAFAELGLPLQADQADVRAAYRSLAMRWHPDVSTDAQSDARMKAINVAYAMVCQHLEVQARAMADTRPDSAFHAFDWRTGFRAAARAAEQGREARVQRTVHVSLFEAAFGCIKRLSGLQPVTCPRCAGSGGFASAWTVGSKCMQCFGRGSLPDTAQAPGVQRTRCSLCKGSGVYRPGAPQCPDCRGSGKTRQRAWLVDVPIYAGTLDGAQVPASDIRVRSGQDLMPRSLELTIRIEKHPLFKLSHDRLSVVVPVSVWRWALGGDLTVPTLDGSTSVGLPSKPSALLIKNKGWPEYKTPEQRHPLFVLPRIVYPEHVGEHEQQLLQTLDAARPLPEVLAWQRNLQAWLESTGEGPAQ